jgi:hypothetical protein
LEIKEENRKRRSLKRNFKSSSARTRLLKDPNAPKHPTSAYLRFFTETYEPGAVISEAAKAASARWKTLSAAEKAVSPPNFIQLCLTKFSRIHKLLRPIERVLCAKRQHMSQVDLEIYD